MPIEFFLSILWMSLSSENFMSLKSSFFAKSLSPLVILLRLWSAGFKCLTKHLTKLSSVFWILIQFFLGWSNSLGYIIKLLPDNGLYFEIL